MGTIVPGKRTMLRVAIMGMMSSVGLVSMRLFMSPS